MIQIKRGAATVATVNPTSSSNMSKAVMGEEQITLVWEAPAFVPFYLGDYITVEGSNWTLNKLPTVKKLSGKTWQYNAVFQSTKYELIKAMYLLFDNTDTLPSGEFPLTGTAETFIELLVANLNRVAGSAVWSVGQVLENTDYKNLTFSNEDCLSVLGRLADEFETEYHVSNHVIHLKKISTNREVTLEYGSTLYDIERSSVDSSDVCTRLYAFGSTKNLASDYRGGNSPLRLPDANGDYIESNVNLYGVIERAKTFDAIYPRLSSGGAGVITSVGDEFTFYDSHLDFNVNDYLLDGTTAKVHFNTGECAGYDFEIASYTHATKKFVLIANTQENDFTLPTADLKPAVGDKYVLIDIVMPPAYLAAAEAELLAKAQEFISQNSTPKVAYKTTFSAIYAKQNLQSIECGDTVTVYDEDMGIEEQIRIIKLQKGLTDFWTVQFDLANTVTATRLERIEGNVSAVENTVIVTNQRVNRNNLRAYQNTKELREMVFDPDGYFDAVNIKPLSIETSMLSVGSKSQSFQLSTLLQPNYTGNPQVLQWSAGLLTHFTIADDQIKEWTIAQGSITITGGNQTAALYIYARCSRAGTTGDIYLSATATKFDADATYYFFLIGVLHTPINSVRGISLTYGQTTINGQYIKTGVISSIDGATYFNLNTGEIGGNIKFKSTDGSLKTVDQAIGDIQIGGKNLLSGTKTTNTQAAFANGVGYYFFTDLLAISTYGLAVGDYVSLAFNLSNMPYGYSAGASLCVEVSGSVIYVVGQTIYQSGQRATITYKLPAGTTRIAPYLRLNQAAIGAITMDYAKLKFEKGNKATDWDLSIADIQQQFTENTSYVNAIKADLQSQIDGNITSFFYDYEPTLVNIPASSWTPDSVRDIHLGDLFYWTSKGYAYRFQKVAGVYSWTKIADTDVTKALADAAKAQDTADGKRRVFVSQPTTPYDLGDLWSQGTTGDLMKCKTAKALAQSYSAADWEKASKYTDDTAVNNLQIGVRNLYRNGDYSNGLFNVGESFGGGTIREVVADSRFGKALRVSSNIRLGQPVFAGIKLGDALTLSFFAKATSAVGITLSGVGFDAGVPTGIGLALNKSLSITTTWTKFSHTWAATADQVDGQNFYFYLPAGDANPIYFAQVKFEKGNKPTDYTRADEDIQSQIDASKSLLADIASDNKLTPNEKQQLKKEWDDIYNEFPIIREQANDVLGAADNYENNYYWLSTYITPLLADLTTTSDIVGSTLRAKFRNYYYNREAVKDDIQRVIDIQSRSLDFMKSAVENGSAEFQGGLGLINLLFMKNLLDQVTGGMSGLDGDNVGFWTGGTYMQALADASKAFKSAMSAAALDKKDGSGHRAFGNFAWNTAGEAFFKGAIEALSGKFGLLNISGETIVSDHLKFTNLPIESKSQATSPKTYTIPAKTQLSQIFKSNPTAVMDSNEIVIETATTIPYVRATKANSSAWYLYSDDESDAATLSSNCYCYVKVKLQCINNGNVILESESANVIVGCINGNYVFPDNGWGTSLSNIAVSAGSVKFRMIATISQFSPNEYVQWVSPAIRLPFNMVVTSDNMNTNSLINISVTSYVKRAFFGSDGFYVFANQNRYVYFRGAGDGSDEFELKLGTKMLRLSDASGWDIAGGMGGASIGAAGGVSANWGKIALTGQVAKSGSNYTITHNIGDTDYSLILTPISTNVPYFSSRAANTVVVTCAGGFDFVLIRTK